jgi:putative ABC transport system permease protein
VGAVVRGIRNLARNRTRSMLVVSLVAVSVAVVVATAAAGASSGEQAERLRRDVATLIQVNPAGVAPGGGSAAGLPESLADELADVQGVVEVDPYVRRQFVDNSQRVPTGVLNGAEPGEELRLSAMGGFTGTPRLVAGRYLSEDEADAAVAVVGRVFAEQNGLEVGSRFTLPGEALAARQETGSPTRDLQAVVVGIFSVDVAFGDNQVFVPLSVAQAVLGTPNQVTQFWVQAAGADQVNQVQERIAARLGDQVDLLASAAQAKRAADSLAAVGSNSLVAAGVAAAVGAVVVLFTMALVTRERRREIGVLKALGASDSTVATQFVVESLALALLGGGLGAAVALLAAGGLAQAVVGGADRLGDYTVSPVAVLAGVGLAAAFGAAGSLYPVRKSLRLRPAEAMRPAE